MIFNPKEGGRLVLHVDEGSLVIDVKSARVAYQHTALSTDRSHQTVIRLDCDLIGTIVHKDTKEDRTEAIILQGDRDDPSAIVLVAKNLTAVNVTTNFPGVTEVTIEAYGLPIEYSKLVERALQEKKPDSRILMPQFVLDKMQRSLMSSGYAAPMVGKLLQASSKPSQTCTISMNESPGKHVVIASPTQSVKVWPRVVTDEEILNDKED